MATSNTIYMARQPIYTRDLSVFAYELLYRRSAESGMAGPLTEADSAQALLNSVIDIGLYQLSGRSKAFINISKDLLLSGTLDMLPKKKVVLEILEDIPPSKAVIDEIKRLSGLGYQLALDDFVLTPGMVPVVPLVKYVKLDVLSLPDMELRKHVSRLKTMGVKLLAEKVENQSMFRFCYQLGFDYFQGYFFTKPQTVRGTTIAPNKLNLVRLIAKLQSPDVEFSDLEEIVGSEVSLNFRLLKFIKSAHFGVPSKVTSIRQSLLFVGVKTVAALATLLAMASLSDKPNELLVTAMVRAKMCENLAVAAKISHRDRYFTVGLLSVLDALLDAPMKDLLEQLPLSDEINSALLDDESDVEMAQILRSVKAYEKGEWDLPLPERLTFEDMEEAYLKAVEWANDTNTALVA